MRWLREMCELVGVVAPSDDGECSRLTRATDAYVIARVRSAIPGAVDAIHTLHQDGYTLYTASGESSPDLESYLMAMGVRPLFEHLYGCDLVNTWKSSRQYYDRIFADAGMQPSECLVIDDSPRAVRWASEAGATAFLVSMDGRESAEAYAVLGSLAGVAAVPGQGMSPLRSESVNDSKCR